MLGTRSWKDGAPRAERDLTHVERGRLAMVRRVCFLRLGANPDGSNATGAPTPAAAPPAGVGSPIGGKEDKTFSLGGSDTRCRGDSIAQWRTPKDVRGLQDHLRPGCGGEAIVGFRVKSLHRLWSVWPTRAKDPQGS